MIHFADLNLISFLDSGYFDIHEQFEFCAQPS